MRVAPESTVRILQSLVQIPSVNPTLVPGAEGEQNIAAYIAQTMQGWGLEVLVDEVAPGRPNAVGILRGDGSGPTLLFNGHMDTVSVEGMADPFSGAIRDGRLYGRGAQDMKASLAATLAAAEALVKSGMRLRGHLVLTFVADEEYASLGTERVVADIRSGRLPQPHAVVNTEPTDLRVGMAHKGFVWVDVETHGRAAHGSRPGEGVDAIAHMGRVLSEIESLGQQLAAGRRHPLLGTGSLHASLIRGGRELSSYPDYCRLQLERRTVPPETAQDVGQEISTLLERLAAADAKFRATSRVTFARPAWEADPASQIVRDLRQAVRTVTGREAEEMVHTAWLDAALLAELGIPTVVFGPTGSGLHSIKEWVDLQSTITCGDVFLQLILDYLL